MKKIGSTQPTEREPYLLRSGRIIRDLNMSQNQPSTSHAGKSPSIPVTRADFEELTNKIIQRLDSLGTDMSAIKKDISGIHATLADLQVATADSAARITVIENQSIPKLINEREAMESQIKDAILALELHDRKLNLLLYGVEKERNENVERKVRSCIQSLGFTQEETNKMSFVNAHRLPRRPIQGEETRRGPDPIIVRFVSMFDRDNVLREYQQIQQKKSKEAQRNSGSSSRESPTFRVVTDLPPQLKRRRFELENHAYQLRKNENKSTRIRLSGIKLVLECREKGSTSPWTTLVH